jgi:hypothetical protein
MLSDFRAKKMRTPYVTAMFNRIWYNKPEVDVTTRRHSIYSMLEQVMKF